MSRLIHGLAFTLLLSLLAAPAHAQGFTLNPFTKKEPEPDSIRRSISDRPPEAKPNSGFFPAMSFPTLPVPQLPKMQLPNPLGIPGLGGNNQPAPTGPRKPGPLAQLNRNTQAFFKSTGEFVTAPFRAMTAPTGTPARQASARTQGIPPVGTSRITPARSRTQSQEKSGGLFGSLPAWLGGSPNNDPPPEPRTVGDFLGQKRPGFDDR